MKSQSLYGDIWRRFFAKVQVDFNTGCWQWTAFIDPKGYGRFRVNNARMPAAHITAFWLFKRYLPPKGSCVDHICRNRKCVNPDHLRELTIVQNSDYWAKRTHCKNGHEYKSDDPSYYWVQYAPGKWMRRCKKCMQSYQLKYLASRSA